MNYRAEIDGLRAVAIVPVLLFHAGWAGMEGGFLGVDVFLVISGYLITSILLKEQAEGRFNLAHFYERRARRILPALFFVLAVTSVAAWWVLNPLQLEDYAYSLLATLGFSANIYFWQHIDYFTGDTNLLPLLHLWSLGIEEQFYFLFPLLLMAVAGFTRRLTWLLIALFMLSLGTALWLSAQHSPAAFYLLPARAWELIAGAGCALYAQQRGLPRGPRAQQLGSALGLIMLLCSMIWLDPRIAHPGGYTLLPVLGTVLIILYAQPHTAVAHLLSLRPLVWIGLLSYSAYLWHQPLFALARHITQQAQLGLSLSAALIVLTFTMSAFSWRFIEQPFRNRAWLSRKCIFQLSAGGIALGGAVMLAVLWQQGFPQRYSPMQQMLFEHQRLMRIAVGFDPCFLSDTEVSSRLGEQCKLSSSQRSALLGDSHGSALWTGLISELPDLAKYTASGCAPLLGEEIAGWRPHCPSVNRFNYEEVAQKQPEQLYLHANWLMYATHLPQDNHDLITEQLAYTLAHIKKVSPHTQVLVVGDVPQWPPSLIEVLSDYAAKHPIDEHTLLPNALYAQMKALDRRLQETTEANGVPFVSLLDLLCQPDGQCRVLAPVADGPWQPMMWDYGHMSATGARYVAQQLLK